MATQYLKLDKGLDDLIEHPRELHLMVLIGRRAGDCGRGPLTAKISQSDFTRAGWTQGHYRVSVKRLEQLGYVTIDASKRGTFATITTDLIASDTDAPETTQADLKGELKQYIAEQVAAAVKEASVPNDTPSGRAWHDLSPKEKTYIRSLRQTIAKGQTPRSNTIQAKIWTTLGKDAQAEQIEILKEIAARKGNKLVWPEWMQKKIRIF